MRFMAASATNVFGRLHALACLLLGLLLIAAERQSRAAELVAERLFEPDRLVEIVIELPAEDWDKLCQQTRDIRTAFSGVTAESPFTYFKGNVTIDGVKIESVGVRKKGFIGSLDNEFPSLKVKFDEYVDQNPVNGINVLTLNNNKQDTALVSQFLTYRLFNAAGVQAPRCNFARITVNGEYLGIYSHVESIGKPFLKRRFGNNAGNLYEGTLADFYPKAIDRLEAKTNEKNHDRSKVTRLAELLAADGELDLAEVEKIVDLDNFLKFWAVESLIGFWDGYCNNQNNYWVYDNRDNGKFYFMPWGADGALMNFRGPFGFGFGAGGPTSVYAESMLANRLYHANGVAERYRATMRKILDEVWNEEELARSITRLDDLVAGHLHQRQAGAPSAMNSMRLFIHGRRAAIVSELENWPVDVSPQPRKPTYAVNVGSAKGKFATVWRDKPAENSLDTGDAEVQLELDGKPVALKQLGATAQLMQPPPFGFGFGGPPGQRGSPPGRRGAARAERPAGGPFGQWNPPATVVLAGVRESDDSKLTLTLSIDPEQFATSAGKTITVQGTVAEGDTGGNPFMPFGARSVDGTLTLDKAGMQDGDAVGGRFDLKVVESRGGFMDRRGPGRGGPGRGGRGARRGGNAPSTEPR